MFSAFCIFWQSLISVNLTELTLGSSSIHIFFLRRICSDMPYFLAVALIPFLGLNASSINSSFRFHGKLLNMFVSCRSHDQRFTWLMHWFTQIHYCRLISSKTIAMEPKKYFKYPAGQTNFNQFCGFRFTDLFISRWNLTKCSEISLV